ncbi:MAG TPA: hypothetical protein VF161_09375 [Steroidobacteraceae bacterium]
MKPVAPVSRTTIRAALLIAVARTTHEHGRGTIDRPQTVSLKEVAGVNPLQAALARAIVPGSAASLLSALALSACSKVQTDSAAGGVNGPSQWIWGERTRRATLRHTALGYAIHHLTSIFWATLHECVFAKERRRRGTSPEDVARMCTQAAVTAASAYFVDYHVTPRRLGPGFEKHVSPGAIFVSYAAFAAGLAAVAIARSLPAPRGGPSRLE